MRCLSLSALAYATAKIHGFRFDLSHEMKNIVGERDKTSSGGGIGIRNVSSSSTSGSAEKLLDGGTS